MYVYIESWIFFTSDNLPQDDTASLKFWNDFRTPLWNFSSEWKSKTCKKKNPQYLYFASVLEQNGMAHQLYF